ncbi:MAG TPA: alginate lyase family protein, partial [Phycisphaerae bacterium]|nr:alginate lyase family protein [Phycisphaerae bacterium]HQE26699.1 alginate lyase family protein [Phycisphaerae bacterium]
KDCSLDRCWERSLDVPDPFYGPRVRLLTQKIGATLLLSLMLAGLMASGCRSDRNSASASPEAAAVEPAAFFEPDASFVAEAEWTDTRELLAAFRKHRRTPPPPKLHLITPTSGLNGPEALIVEGFAIWNYPAVSVQPPVDWTMDPFNDVSWRYQLNTLVFLDPLLRACAESPDPRYLRFALDVVRDWLAQNWDRSNNPNEFAWYDMAVGVRAPKIAWLAHAAACSDDIDDSALIDLLRGVMRHAKELRDPANLSKQTNHGIYQMLGLLGLIRTLPEMRGFGEYERYALHTVESLFDGHYCVEEGAHLEHSPAYHLYLTNLLRQSLSTGLLPNIDRLESLQDRAFNVLAWMVKPDGSLARFGDGADNRTPTRVISEALRERYPACWFVQTRGQQGTPDQEESLILPKSGYAFVRGKWPRNPQEWQAGSYLAFMAAFHSRTHKHADDGTFEWSELGRPILIDAGGFAYDYQSPERQYCESTRAHNTLEIDGTDLSRDLADVYGSAIKRWTNAGGTHAIEAEFSRKPDIRHRRTLIYRPREWLVVSDEVTAAGEHVYTQWFHFDPELDIQLAKEHVSVPIPGADRQVLVKSLSDTSMRAVHGQYEPRLEGWTSLQYRKLTPNWAVAYTASGRTVHLVTLFALTSTGTTAIEGAVEAAEPNQLELQWQTDGQTTRVSLYREGDELKLDVMRAEVTPEAG